MKPSFTILELVIVIIIIGILISTISISIPNNHLRIAADNLAKNIRFAESLALKDDKYQPFPKNNTSKEQNRSKYWFKQWWQVRFSTFNSNGQTHYWYEIFTDVPSKYKTKNFTAQANLPTNAWQVSIAKNPLDNKLMIGHCGVSHYPNCDQTDQQLDLTKSYGIKKLKFTNFYSHSPRLVFDNYGNVFLKEGQDGDAGDTNPVDKNNRIVLTQNANIKLCLDNPCKYQKDRCLQVNITPNGYVFISKCN